MQKSKIKKIILLSLTLLFLNITFAEAKSYYYDSIDFKIQINKDSTFDVEEKLNYNFAGDFHAADRIVPLDKISAITDIEVVDAETGKPLKYTSSSKRLDHLNPSNWGSFVYFKENGRQIIDWYFNLSNTKHEWIVKYRVHGGIGFFDDKDELYWNLFSGYDVPVSKSEAYVHLPQSADVKDLEANFYANIKTVSFKIIDGKTFYYNAGNIPPHQPLTIYAGWPKGIVDQSAYWKDFVKLYWGYILGIFIILLSVLSGFLHWYFTEKHNAGRGTIIPQYEPPQNLRPAMAEVIIKEKITDKAWPATVVDLAVRGYVRIKEDTAYWGDIVGSIMMFIIFLPIILLSMFFLYPLFISMKNEVYSLRDSLPLFIFLILFISLFVRIFIKNKLKDTFVPKNYIVEKLKFFENDPAVEDYEKSFLGILFGSKEYFSTKELKKSGNLKKQEFSESFRKLKDKLYEETELDTNAFENGISKEKIKTIIWMIIIFVLAFFGRIIMADQYIFLLTSIIVSGAGLFAFMKYEARLNKEGQILKEDWLGFKMFLETAERYRLQNLTPDTFEKYLPYAMIFGVEKKWAKAFESLNIQQPSWYVSSAGAHGFVGGTIAGGGFSPSAFSSSFSSSFASAFHSSTGGGGGGGGSAGGGGGGGGGGAR